MAHTLPDLPYAFDALEPYIDAQTMAIHHGKHHAAYVANLNKAIESHPDLEAKTIEQLLAGIETLPDSIRTAVRNNGGGHFNHSLFWPSLAPSGNGGAEPGGELARAITSVFGDFAKFRTAFTDAAMTRFGSGWAWLGFDKAGKLHVGSTANQDAPIMEGHKPILGLDVWEHAYYLKYQNRRADYVAAWWNLVNWRVVEERFAKARK